MLLKGFKFGMLLQFAIGPVCIFIFQMASSRGFYIAETGVLGVVLMDGLFILSAIIGLASILERKNVKLYLKISGAIILFIFGTSILLGQFNIDFLPSFKLPLTHSKSLFLQAILLTVSNPLTIVFWAGVFSTKIAEGDWIKKDIYAFGFGALMSTLFFLSCMAFLGSFTKTFFPLVVIELLNIIVGILLIYFGIRMLFKKVT